MFTSHLIGAGCLQNSSIHVSHGVVVVGSRRDTKSPPPCTKSLASPRIGGMITVAPYFAAACSAFACPTPTRHYRRRWSWIRRSGEGAKTSAMLRDWPCTVRHNNRLPVTSYTGGPTSCIALHDITKSDTTPKVYEQYFHRTAWWYCFSPRCCML